MKLYGDYFQNLKGEFEMDNFKMYDTAEEIKEVEEWISRNIEAMMDAYHDQSIENLSDKTNNYFHGCIPGDYLGYLCSSVTENIQMMKKYKEIMNRDGSDYYIQVIFKEKIKENEAKNTEED